MFGFNKKKDKKYVLTNDTYICDDGTKLYRIKAVRDFGLVKKGALGGYIERETNLSHRGDCWVTYDARVSGWATVTEHAIVKDSAKVSGFCNITGSAIIGGTSKLRGDVFCDGKTYISGRSSVYGDVNLISASIIDGYINCYGCDTIQIRGGRFDAFADIRHCRHLIVAGPLGSRDDFTTIFRNNIGQIIVRTGCFNGTIDEFEQAVKDDHDDNQYAKEYMALIELAKVHICLRDDPDEEE